MAKNTRIGELNSVLGNAILHLGKVRKNVLSAERNLSPKNHPTVEQFNFRVHTLAQIFIKNLGAMLYANVRFVVFCLKGQKVG